MDVNGLRLGEKSDTVYQEGTVQLEPGDLVFFYTDGVCDIQNPKLEKWGERTFLRSLLSAVNVEGDPKIKMEAMLKNATDYRQSANLIDDVTLFMVEWNPAREMKEAS